jgi:hypothetical protein
VVVILGAGASAPFGVPTLRHIFTDTLARQQLSKDAFLRTRLEDVFWAPRGLNINSSPTGPTVEDILTILRDSERQDTLPKILDGEADTFRHRLYVLIKKAVFDMRSSQGKHLNPVIKLFSHTAVTEVTWASFNWDCLFESSFYYNSGPMWWYRSNPKICVPLNGWASPSASSRHTFLKLHGGVNWWFEDNQLVYLPFSAGGTLNSKWAAYDTNDTPGQPVLLEPSFYKYESELYSLVQPQWEVFAHRLAEADCVVVIGYSLPEADANARSVITLGFQANPKARWYIIDPEDGICARYTKILGRTVVTPLPFSLQDVAVHLEDIISADFPFLKPESETSAAGPESTATPPSENGGHETV